MPKTKTKQRAPRASAPAPNTPAITPAEPTPEPERRHEDMFGQNYIVDDTVEALSDATVQVESHTWERHGRGEIQVTIRTMGEGDAPDATDLEITVKPDMFRDAGSDESGHLTVRGRDYEHLLRTLTWAVERARAVGIVPPIAAATTTAETSHADA